MEKESVRSKHILLTINGIRVDRTKKNNFPRCEYSRNIIAISVWRVLQFSLDHESLLNFNVNIK